MDQPNNGIAAHANKTRHDILWDSAEVLEQETNWTNCKQRFKEALQIQAADKTMNLDTGLQLNPIWSTIRTRALPSTKPSAHCMALAKCFNSCMQKGGS